MLAIELTRETDTVRRNEARRRWLAAWRDMVGDLGLGGYATLEQPRRLTAEEEND